MASCTCGCSIAYTQADHAVVAVEDWARAQALSDRWHAWPWQRWLQGLARQVHPWAFATAQQPKPYYWTLRQAEYATDVGLRDTALSDWYPRWLAHAMPHFGADDVLRFLGRTTDARFAGEVTTDLKRRVDGIRIKHWVEDNSLKRYDKAGGLLRIEASNAAVSRGA